jgi:hypothetical protein
VKGTNRFFFPTAFVNAFLVNAFLRQRISTHFFVNAFLVLLAMGAGASSHVKKLNKEILQEAIKRKVDNNVAV